jgi:hypothetical protein
MFNVNNAPVPYRELVAFAQVVARAVIERRFAPETTDLVLAVDDGPEVALLAIGPNERDGFVAASDQLLARRRRLSALASVVGWSPDAETQTTPAWLVIAVGVGGAPAVTLVRRVEEDTGWWQLGTTELPWVALSTAAALRAALEHGAPLRLKTTGSDALFQRPSQRPRPPLDERGEL